MKATHEQMKQLFIEGKNITDIATYLHVTRQTIYAAKNKDFKNGVDWDELRLAKLQDVAGVKMSEKAFLGSLIKSYEEALEGLNALEPKERLMLTTQYAQAYYRLKAPLKTDCKAQVFEAITTSIYKISEMALEEDNKVVIEFLSKHSEKIVQRCMSNVKGKS
ncbi:MAG: DUF1804 family protein [Sulfurospirillaceae bacterium]|nr:DUF1804 family protein [Sulfurospirillaceae bacterium]